MLLAVLFLTNGFNKVSVSSVAVQCATTACAQYERLRFTNLTETSMALGKTTNAGLTGLSGCGRARTPKLLKAVSSFSDLIWICIVKKIAAPKATPSREDIVVYITLLRSFHRQNRCFRKGSASESFSERRNDDQNSLQQLFEKLFMASLGRPTAVLN